MVEYIYMFSSMWFNNIIKMPIFALDFIKYNAFCIKILDITASLNPKIFKVMRDEAPKNGIFHRDLKQSRKMIIYSDNQGIFSIIKDTKFFELVQISMASACTFPLLCALLSGCMHFPL